MDRKELIQQIKEKQSFLCVGLDTDINKIQCTHHRRHSPLLCGLQTQSGFL